MRQEKEDLKFLFSLLDYFDEKSLKNIYVDFMLSRNKFRKYEFEIYINEIKKSIRKMKLNKLRNRD